ncbi:hypothetical protein BESB_040070 [Besnoitia besnoiti]|uniref:Prolyl endopeptidase-like n=1 Tax=Besnoitia besnoiti TaxID=94643 RepID=A0A2A9MI25_BESBE|nr:hypothetical protein BESB_040070 [Besnoitia besnoiti]PFH37549.1 hypothetical protein BESB_040070 [Besnoitia besnoiti]
MTTAGRLCSLPLASQRRRSARSRCCGRPRPCFASCSKLYGEAATAAHTKIGLHCSQAANLLRRELSFSASIQSLTLCHAAQSVLRALTGAARDASSRTGAECGTTRALCIASATGRRDCATPSGGAETLNGKRGDAGARACHSLSSPSCSLEAGAEFAAEPRDHDCNGDAFISPSTGSILRPKTNAACSASFPCSETLLFEQPPCTVIDPWQHLETNRDLLQSLLPSAVGAPDAQEESTSEGNNEFEVEGAPASARRRGGRLEAYGASGKQPEICWLQSETEGRGDQRQSLARTRRLLKSPLDRYLAFITKHASALDFVEQSLGSAVVAASPSSACDEAYALDGLTLSRPAAPSPGFSPLIPSVREAFEEEERRVLEAVCGKTVGEIAKSQAMAALCRSPNAALQAEVRSSASHAPSPSNSWPADLGPSDESQGCPRDRPSATHAAERGRRKASEEGKAHGGEAGERQAEGGWRRVREAALLQVEAAAEAGELAEAIHVEVLEGRMVYYERPSPFSPGHVLFCRRALPGRDVTLGDISKRTHPGAAGEATSDQEAPATTRETRGDEATKASEAAALEARSDRTLTLADVLRAERQGRRKAREEALETETNMHAEDAGALSPFLLERPGVWTALDVLRSEQQLIDLGWLAARAQRQTPPSPEAQSEEMRLEGMEKELTATDAGVCRLGTVKVFEEAGLLGYTRCLDSSDRYTLHFKDLRHPTPAGLFSSAEIPATFSRPSLIISALSMRSPASCEHAGDDAQHQIGDRLPSAPFECEEVAGVSLGFVKDFEFFACTSESVESGKRDDPTLPGSKRAGDELPRKEVQTRLGAREGMEAQEEPIFLGCLYSAVEAQSGRPHMLRRCLLALWRLSRASPAAARDATPAAAPSTPVPPRLELLRDELVLDLSDTAKWSSMHLALSKTADGRFFIITATSRSRTATWILSASHPLDSLRPVVDGPTHCVTSWKDHLLLFDVSSPGALSAFSLSLRAVLEGRGMDSWMRRRSAPLASFSYPACAEVPDDARREGSAQLLFQLCAFHFSDLDCTEHGLAVYGLRPPSCPVVMKIDLEEETNGLGASEDRCRSPKLQAACVPPSPPPCSPSSALSSSPSLISCSSSLPELLAPVRSSPVSSLRARIFEVRLPLPARRPIVGCLQPAANSQFSSPSLHFSLQSPFEPCLHYSLNLRTARVEAQRLQEADREVLQTAARLFHSRFFPAAASPTPPARLSALAFASPPFLAPSSASAVRGQGRLLEAADSMGEKHVTHGMFARAGGRNMAEASEISERDARGNNECSRERTVDSGSETPAEALAPAEKVDTSLGVAEIVYFPSRDGNYRIPVTILLSTADAEDSRRTRILGKREKNSSADATGERGTIWARHTKEGKADAQTAKQPEPKTGFRESAGGIPEELHVARSHSPASDFLQLHSLPSPGPATGGAASAASFSIPVAPFSSSFFPAPYSSSRSSLGYAPRSPQFSSHPAAAHSAAASPSPCSSVPLREFASSCNCAVASAPLLSFSPSSLFLPRAPSPLLLLAYGAYKRPLSVAFSPLHLMLLSLGWRVAFVHCRGEGAAENEGTHNGRGLRKHETLDDLEDALNALVALNVSKREQIFLKTSSAGGVLAGAFLAFQHMRGQVRALVIRHGFFDVFTAMQAHDAHDLAAEDGERRQATDAVRETQTAERGEATPEDGGLRALEEVEWGNPNVRDATSAAERDERRRHLANILSFSPYSNFHPPRRFAHALAAPACASCSLEGREGDWQLRRLDGTLSRASARVPSPRSPFVSGSKGPPGGAEHGVAGALRCAAERRPPAPEEAEKKQRDGAPLQAATGSPSSEQTHAWWQRASHPKRSRREWPAVFLTASLGDTIVSPWHSAKILAKLERMRQLRQRMQLASHCANDDPRRAEGQGYGPPRKKRQSQLSAETGSESPAGERTSGALLRDAAEGVEARDDKDKAASLKRKTSRWTVESAFEHSRAEKGAGRDDEAEACERSEASHAFFAKAVEGRSRKKRSSETRIYSSKDMRVASTREQNASEDDFVLFKLSGEEEGHCGRGDMLSRFRDEAEELCFFYRVLEDDKASAIKEKAARQECGDA